MRLGRLRCMLVMRCRASSAVALRCGLFFGQGVSVARLPLWWT